MKKYFKLITVLLLSMPVIGLADFDATLKLLGQARNIENSAGSLLDSNSALRDGLNNLYERIIEMLKVELISISPRTTSISFDSIAAPLSKEAIQTITFRRTPVNSLSPVNFTIETGTGKLVGNLANNVTENSFNWQVADNFVVGKDYLIIARSSDDNVLLGKSANFIVSSTTVAQMPMIIATTTIPVIVPPPAPEPLSNAVGSSDINFGSLGYWSFDRGGNNCDTKGGATTNADGKIGTALGLNGVNAYCTVSNNRTFYPKTFTLALWAKSDSSFTSGWNDSNWFVSLRDRSGYDIGPVKGTKNVQFTILDDTNLNQTPYVVGMATPDNISDWHHYAMTYDGTVANVYLDGALVNSTTTSIARNNSGDRDLHFGYDDVSGQPVGAGTLDEIRLYNRPMTACEIRFLAGKGCSGIANVFDPSTNIAAVGASF